MAHIDIGVAKSNYDLYVRDKLNALSCMLDPVRSRIESDGALAASDFRCRMS